MYYSTAIALNSPVSNTSCIICTAAAASHVSYMTAVSAINFREDKRKEEVEGRKSVFVLVLHQV